MSAGAGTPGRGMNRVRNRYEPYSTCSCRNPSAAPTIDELIAKMSVETKDLEVDKFFRALVKFEGSDLHMKVGRPPHIRVRNELRPLNHPNIERIEMAKLLVPMMNDRCRRIYDDEGGA